MLSRLLISFACIALLTACDTAEVKQATKKTWDNTRTYWLDKWEAGQSVEEALAESKPDAEGKRSIELCDLSASGLTDFVGGAATMGAVIPMIAGQNVVIILTSTAGLISISPAVDPTLTTAATSIAVAYGAMKIYCHRDKIIGNQSVQALIATVNKYSGKSVEAVKAAYAAMRGSKDTAGGERVTEDSA